MGSILKPLVYSYSRTTLSTDTRTHTTQKGLEGSGNHAMDLRFVEHLACSRKP